MKNEKINGGVEKREGKTVDRATVGLSSGRRQCDTADVDVTLNKQTQTGGITLK